MSMNWFATTCFALAILHTLVSPRLRPFAHWLGEVELVFILWAAVLLIGMWWHDGFLSTKGYVETLSFREPLFVFILMTASATRPIMHFAERAIEYTSRLLPFPPVISFYAVALTLGPLFGSLITEPAAMTVTAFILRRRYYSQTLSPGLMYATIALLFVNVSIGGTMTVFAAPPVLMVAENWEWTSTFMLQTFAWKAALACVISTALVIMIYKRELLTLEWRKESGKRRLLPYSVTTMHLLALALIVAFSHRWLGLALGFGVFLALVFWTRDHHHLLRVRAAGMVALFLSGLVILGPIQAWWLEPALARLHGGALFLGSMALTAIIDNAALTYLGGQVGSLTPADRYLLVAGAVAGGGLSILANAPNPAGYGILNQSFRGRLGPGGLSARRLLQSALLPTGVAAVCLYFF